jgi:DNA polymerase-3 subunit delta
MMVTLTGGNDFLVRAELDGLVQKFLAEFGDLGLERLNGDEVEYDSIREALQSLPFFAARKMVILRDGSANKQFVENAETLLGELPDSTDVILYEPKLDKRTAYYKFLKKSTDFREFVAMDENGLARWLMQAAKEKQGSLSSSDARFLVERVGANQQMLAHELDKLLLYTPNITRETIELLTEAAPQSTVFELLESAFAGNAKRALELYAEQRAQKVEPQQIIAMLAWQLHIVALAKTAGQRSPETAAKEAKISPFVFKKSAAIARKLTLAQLKKLVKDLLDIDRRSKRESLDVDEAVQNYLLQIANS